MAKIALQPLPLFATADPDVLHREEEVCLPSLCLGEHVVQDYLSLSLSLKAHPLALLRPRMTARRITPNTELAIISDGTRVTIAGLVLVRQRPGTAKGVIFATLEDETGIANVIVWPKVFEIYRRPLLAARLLAVTGKLQRQGLVIHVVAQHLADLSADLTLLSVAHGEDIETCARADEVNHGSHERRTNRIKRAGLRETPAIGKSRDFR